LGAWLRPDPLGEFTALPQAPYLNLRVPTSKGRGTGGVGWEGTGGGGEGRGRGGKGRGGGEERKESEERRGEGRGEYAPLALGGWTPLCRNKD